MSILELTRVRNELAAADDLLRQAIEALRDVRQSVFGETGFANAIRTDAGHPYPWPAMDEAEVKIDTVLAIAKERGL